MVGWQFLERWHWDLRSFVFHYGLRIAILLVLAFGTGFCVGLLGHRPYLDTWQTTLFASFRRGCLGVFLISWLCGLATLASCTFRTRPFFLAFGGLLIVLSVSLVAFETTGDFDRYRRSEDLPAQTQSEEWKQAISSKMPALGFLLIVSLLSAGVGFRLRLNSEDHV